MPKNIANLFNARQAKVPGRLVSLDIPSGICSDSGTPFSGGGAVAAFTLTVGLIKKGLVQDSGLQNVGSLVRIDFGLPPQIFEKLSCALPLRISSSDLHTLRLPHIPLTASKYQRG